MNEVTDKFVEAVSEEVGMYPGAWDTVDPKLIIAAVLKVARESKEKAQ